jgi:hypothetical protein
MSEPSLEQRDERSAHAIYGLIIITSTLVADRLVSEDPLQSLALVWGAGIVLLLAHVYSAAVAEAGGRGRWLNHAERHLLIVDNVPVLAALIAPTVLLLAAELGIMELRAALDLAVLFSIGALFVVGAFQARRQGASLGVQMTLGLMGGIIGAAVVLLEVWMGH